MSKISQIISDHQRKEMTLAWETLRKRSLEYAIKQLKDDIQLIQNQITIKESQLKDVEAKIKMIQERI